MINGQCYYGESGRVIDITLLFIMGTLKDTALKQESPYESM